MHDVISHLWTAPYQKSISAECTCYIPWRKMFWWFRHAAQSHLFIIIWVYKSACQHSNFENSKVFYIFSSQLISLAKYIIQVLKKGFIALPLSTILNTYYKYTWISLIIFQWNKIKNSVQEWIWSWKCLQQCMNSPTLYL